MRDGGERRKEAAATEPSVESIPALSADRHNDDGGDGDGHLISTQFH